MYISRGPSLSDEKIRCGDIFGDTTDGNTAYIVEGCSAADISRAGTPGSVESILDGLSHVNEEIERLADGIRAGRIVEQLRWASHGDLAVGKQVRKACTQPVRLGNL